jgi:hypothetical protein
VWLVVAQVVSLVHVISQARVDVGYTASRWRRRVGPDVVRRLQSYSAIATTRPDALWVGTGLSSTRLPDRTGAPAAIEAQLAGLRRSLGAKGAVVDLPDFGLGRRTYMLDAPTTARRLGFRLAWAKDSVRVYVPRHRPRPLTRN